VPEPARAEPAAGKRRALVGAALAGGVALLVLPVAFSDGRKLLEVVSSVRLEGLTAAVVLTVLSYLAMSRSYQGIACAAGADLPFRQWVRMVAAVRKIRAGPRESFSLRRPDRRSPAGSSSRRASACAGPGRRRRSFRP